MRSEIVKTSFSTGADCQIDGDAGRVQFARSPVIGVFVRKRAASLGIAAALLATVWPFEAHGSPQIRHLVADARARAQHEVFAPELEFRGLMDARYFDRTAKSVRLAQAAPDDPVELQKALVQEHDRAELLARELIIHRHLEMLLTLHRARATTARFTQPSENEHSDLEEHLQERLRLKQAAESGAEELCKALSDDRPGQSDQAQAIIVLRTSLQQVRDRADSLEQDLAAAKRDLANERALVAKANEQSVRAKRPAESDATELRTLLQQERQRAAQLQKDLAAARRDGHPKRTRKRTRSGTLATVTPRN
jgi:hypothetical protein